ncbi:hypothetical protein KM043_000025, partial [Ampulex compressa]
IAMGPFLPKKDFTDLEDGTVYIVTMMRQVTTRFGTKVVVELKGEFQVFLPSRVSRALVENNNLYEELLNKMQHFKLFIDYQEGDKFKFSVQ